MKKIDEIYNDIAHQIVNAINDSWDEAIIQFSYMVDAGEFDCIYKKDNKEEEYDFDVEYESYKSFKSLHEITTEGGNNKWNRAKFTLAPSGEFEIDFEWDQALADEIESNS